MKTALEWLINELGYKDLDESEYPTLSRILEQAKEMEKEQMLNFERLLMEHEINSLTFDTAYLTPEEFYDKTYNSK